MKLTDIFILEKDNKDFYDNISMAYYILIYDNTAYENLDKKNIIIAKKLRINILNIINFIIKLNILIKVRYKDLNKLIEYFYVDFINYDFSLTEINYIYHLDNKLYDIYVEYFKFYALILKNFDIFYKSVIKVFYELKTDQIELSNSSLSLESSLEDPEIYKIKNSFIYDKYRILNNKEIELKLRGNFMTYKDKKILIEEINNLKELIKEHDGENTLDYEDRMMLINELIELIKTVKNQNQTIKIRKISKYLILKKINLIELDVYLNMKEKYNKYILETFNIYDLNTYDNLINTIKIKIQNKDIFSDKKLLLLKKIFSKYKMEDKEFIKEFIFDYRYIYINNNYELYYLVDIEQYNYIINILKDSNLKNKLILINKIKSIEEKFDDFNNLTNKLADEIDNKYKIIDKFTIESELFTENSNKKIKLYSYFYDMISNKVEKKDYKKKIIESKIFNFKKINEKFNEICLHFEINFDNVEIIDYKSLNVYLDNVYIYYIYVLRIKELYKFLLLLKNKEDLNSIYNIIKILKKLLNIIKEFDNEYISNILKKNLNEIYGNIEKQKYKEYFIYENINDFIIKLDNFLITIY
jgi:hypothetical protein